MVVVVVEEEEIRISWWNLIANFSANRGANKKKKKVGSLVACALNYL